MTTTELLDARLRAAFAPTRLEIADESAAHAKHPGARGGGGHYVVTIESSRFAGRSRLERHRLVFAAAGDLLPARIHALSVRALAPGEG